MATIVKMPALSDTMTEGTLVSWFKKVGDKVEMGDLLAEIETDKAVMEFSSPAEGVLLYTGIEAGASAKVDTILAIFGQPGEDFQALLQSGGNSQPAATKEETPSKEVLDTITAPLSGNNNTADDDARLKASPLAKAMAKEAGINISEVKGSGDDGRIVKRDVEAYLESQKTTEATPQRHQPAAVVETSAEGAYEDVPVSQMRKTIARRLGDSKFSAPHFYLTMEINMDKLMAVRTQINALADVKISFNDFIVKAAAKALLAHPTVNASWLGDKIRYYKYVNVGVAVAMDEGLIVPVIRNTDQKSLSQVAKDIQELAAKARDRKLQPSEMQGNTFTISNLGMFGIDEFTAIINPPDACILAVGRIAPKLVLVNGEVKETNVMKVTLSCDHRVVDGASGSKFLQTLRDILEEPLRLIV